MKCCTASIAVMLSVCSTSTFTLAAAVRTVALTGQQVAGLPNGVTLGSFSVGSHGNNTVGVALNDAGQTAFSVTLGGVADASNNKAIFSEGHGSLGLVARSGDQAPGMSSGVVYGSVGTARLNNAGQAAFVATLTGSGVGPT